MSEDPWYQSISDYEDGSDIQRPFMQNAGGQCLPYRNTEQSTPPQYDSSAFGGREQLGNARGVWSNNACSSSSAAADSVTARAHGGSLWPSNAANDDGSNSSVLGEYPGQANGSDCLPNVAAVQANGGVHFDPNFYNHNSNPPNFLQAWAMSVNNALSGQVDGLPRGDPGSFPYIKQEDDATHPMGSIPFGQDRFPQHQGYLAGPGNSIVSPKLLRNAPSPSSYHSDSFSEASAPSPFDANDFGQGHAYNNSDISQTVMSTNYPPLAARLAASSEQPMSSNYNHPRRHRKQLPTSAPGRRNGAKNTQRPGIRVPESESEDAEETETSDTFSDADEDTDYEVEDELVEESSPPVHQASSMGRTKQTAVAMRDRAAKDRYLIAARRAGLTYKEVKRRGKFSEAESTLRGRFRTLTKRKEERVRRPEWTREDITLLIEAVNNHRKKDPYAHKIPWKLVAEYIKGHGGSYHFGNATCRKKWDELVATGITG